MVATFYDKHFVPNLTLNSQDGSSKDRKAHRFRQMYNIKEDLKVGLFTGT